MKDIVDILFQHGKEIFASFVFQTSVFVVMLCLWIKPFWLELNHSWIFHIQVAAPLVVIFIFVCWVVKIFIYIGKKLKFKEEAKESIHQIITNNHIYSSYLENNFLYTIYNEKLKIFSFEKICGLAREKDLATTEGIEETIEFFLERGILQRKKELYIVPNYIWTELSYYAKSKQLRRKR